MVKLFYISVLLFSGWITTVVATTATATITSRDCKLLVHHQGGAEYKPGVDVRGRKVRSAGAGGGSTFKLPKEFSFNIGVDIAAKYGLDVKNISADLNLGKVTVRGGRVFMNGKPMTTNERAALTAKCKKLLSGK
jgi:hypothetical protein